MKLYLLQEMSDPYEPRSTLAICSSLEAMKALPFDKAIWRHLPELDTPERPSFPGSTYMISENTYENIKTGNRKVYGSHDFGPDITVEEMELDKLYP